MKYVLSAILVITMVSVVRAEPSQNATFYVPQSGTIVCDGDLSDWTHSTAWSAPFILWAGSGPATTSLTQVKFTWSAASNLLYVAYRTTEASQQAGGHPIIGISQTSIGVPTSAVGATQLAFDVAGGVVNIMNEIQFYSDTYSLGWAGGGISGVQAGYTVSDGVYTFEMAVPLWDNWATMTTQKNLAVGDVLYFYGVMEDKLEGGNGTNMTYPGNPTFYAGLGGDGAALTLVPESYTGNTIIFKPWRLADGVIKDMSNGYQSGASVSLNTTDPDWNSSTASLARCAGDFNAPIAADMMAIRFRDLFGSGPIQIPNDAEVTILKAELKINVWEGYNKPADTLRCYTGLTEWYTTYDGSDFSTSAWRKWSYAAWDGSATEDKPRHGIDYNSVPTDEVDVSVVQGSGMYSINQYITFDVTKDVRAYKAGTLTNNGWWIGSNQPVADGFYQLGTFHSGWDLQPSLEVTWRIGPLTCADLSPAEKNKADLDGNCIVNFADFAKFAENWTVCNDPAGCL